MKVSEFVNGYTRNATDNLKNVYLKKNIESKKYIPFVEKQVMADKIINSTSYELDDDGIRTGNVKINSTSRYLFTIMTIIDAYTNIDVDYSSIHLDYDMLCENGLISLILNLENPANSIIPVEDYMEFNTILNMKLDDFLRNNLSTESFISSQVTRFGMLTGNILEPIINKLADAVNNMDDKKMEKLISGFGKLMNK